MAGRAEGPDVDIAIAGLVLMAAAIHPLRDLLLKGNANAGSGYFSIILIWLLIATGQVVLTGADLASAAAVWPLMLFSGFGLVAYYLGILSAMRAGEFSVYYPIIRSAPVFMVVAGWLVLGERYSAAILAGAALVTLGAWLLQYRPGANLLHAPATLAAALIAMAGMGTQSLSDAEAMQHLQAPVLLFWEYVIVLTACGLYLVARRPADVPLKTVFFGGWAATPWRFLVAGCTSYLSYYLILTAYQRGGDAVAVNCLRQASIPLSVILGGLVLRELDIPSRFAWSLLLAAGIVVIIVGK